jgi:hypothetical protein
MVSGLACLALRTTLHALRDRLAASASLMRTSIRSGRAPLGGSPARARLPG